MFFLLTGGIVALIIFAVLGFQIFYLDRAYPGVTMAGVDVGGMTPPEIEQVITSQTDDYLKLPLTIKVGEEEHVFTKEELGLQVDVTATANKAYNIGRQGNLLPDLATHLSLLSKPQDVQPIILYDSGPSHQILQSLIDVSNYPPQSAQIVIHSADKVELIPAKFGQRLHIDATRPLIEASIFSDNPQPITAVVQQIRPDLTDEDVAPTYQQITRLLSRPFYFNYRLDEDKSGWHLEPKTIVSMINLVEWVDSNGKLQLTMELDKEMFLPYFEEFAKAIDREAVDAELAFDEENNQVVVLKESQDGRKLDVEKTYQDTVAAVSAGANTIELPVQATPAAVSSHDLDSLGIKELVTESTSYFKGSSEGRMRNIELSASKFDGVVIPPGKIFSFNQHLGPVTKEAGYDESLIIFGNRTTVGIGGGVCQVSTTAFRTAFLGGFEIVERWAHGYRVGWYEINSDIGLDATIYAPNVDFKFRNDTGHHLLIHTESDLEAGTVTFKFFGTAPDREVIVGEPVITNVVRHGPPVYEQDPSLPTGRMKQVDWAKDGMDVSVTRLVKEGDTVLYEDEIVSRYSPWKAVYKVGTGGAPITSSAP